MDIDNPEDYVNEMKDDKQSTGTEDFKIGQEKIAAYLRIYIMKAHDVVGIFSLEDLRGALVELVEDIDSAIEIKKNLTNGK